MPCEANDPFRKTSLTVGGAGASSSSIGAGCARRGVAGRQAAERAAGCAGACFKHLRAHLLAAFRLLAGLLALLWVPHAAGLLRPRPGPRLCGSRCLERSGGRCGEAAADRAGTTERGGCRSRQRARLAVGAAMRVKGWTVMPGNDAGAGLLRPRSVRLSAQPCRRRPVPEETKSWPRVNSHRSHRRWQFYTPHTQLAATIPHARTKSQGAIAIMPSSRSLPP